jgi:fucose 4-O-acetylase-like acetyltransferase
MTSVDSSTLKLNPPPVERISWLDYAKGIGIFLVVLGHDLRGLITSSVLQPSAFLSSIDEWIYAFHMPLFFFISGLFIERAAAKPLQSFLSIKFKTIVYPYFVWSILQEFLRLLSGNPTEAMSNIWQILYHPVKQFWFLYVLFILSCAYALLRRYRVSTNVFFFICILLYGAHVWNINFGPWGVVYMTRLNAIYFGMGAFVAQTGLLNRSPPPPKVLLGSAIAGFTAITIAVLLHLTKIPLIAPLLATSGILASFALAQWLAHYAPQGFLKTWGFLSLQIFVAHSLFSAIARLFLQKVHADPALHVVLETAAGIYGAIALYWICNKLKFPYAFTLRPAKT